MAQLEVRQKIEVSIRSAEIARRVLDIPRMDSTAFVMLAIRDVASELKALDDVARTWEAAAVAAKPKQP